MSRGRRGEQDFQDLAALYGVATSYVGEDGAVHEAEPGVVLSILRALGVAIDHPKDARRAGRSRRLEMAQRMLEPVIVLREGQSTDIVVTIPERVPTPTLWLTFEFEDGTTRHDRLAESSATFHSALDVEGERFRQFRFQLAKHGVNIPFGYHSLTVEAGTARHLTSSSRSLLICAPRCPQPSRGWGVFLPVHALRTKDDWGWAATATWPASVSGRRATGRR